VAPAAPTATHPPGRPVPAASSYPSPWRRAQSYLTARPVLVLVLLSPGIPEYLSGSSQLQALLLAPGWFLIQLGLNLGLYGPGVLLIREARVRWNAGFLTVLLLGAAYAILEEGVALSTMFNPDASVVGALGSYGHFLGVNAVWVPGILMIHMVYSIGLPILLVDLALPATRGRSLVSDRQALYLFAVLSADVALLFSVVYLGESFFMGAPLLVGSFVAIGLLVLAGRRTAPWRPTPIHPPGSNRLAFALGLTLFPGVLLTEGLSGAANAPAAVTILLAVLVMAGIGLGVRRYVVGPGARPRWLAFAFGAFLPIMVAGAATNLPFDVALIADGLVVLWFLRLRDAPVADDRSPVMPAPLPGA
jgi:hypothetical protein